MKKIKFIFFSHQCDVPGCGKALIIDGGLKPHRPICQAKLNGLKKFSLAGVSTVTGCTAIPIPGEKYCKQHLKSGPPAIPADFLTVQSKTRLREHKKETSSSEEARNDSIFVI